MKLKISQFTRLFFLLCCLMAASGFREEPLAKDIDVKEAREMIKKNGEMIIVDVRTPGEFAEGHIDGAQNINFFGPRFEMDIMRLPKDKPILLYCRSGRRSEGAADLLEKAGYENVLNMGGGINAWEKAGGKLKK